MVAAKKSVAPAKSVSVKARSVALPKAAPKPLARPALNTLKKPAAVEPQANGVKYVSGLNRKDLDQFRQMLMLKRAQLRGDVNSLQAEALHKNRQDASGDLSSMPIHMADLGTDNYEQEFTLGLLQGEQALLREIDEALERIEKGTYGLCLATGKPIGKARLRATPWAKYSYEYTLAQEKGRRRI